jgi:hypothetical protein
MADYGYTQREDPPARAIPSQSPTSRVASPTRLESRAVEAAIKAQADSEPYLVTQMMIGDGIMPIGNAFASASGGTGSATNTFGWQTATNRYGRRCQVTGQTGFGAGYHFANLIPIITPRAWLDPAWIGSRGPAIVRISDVVRFSKDSVPNTQGWVTGRWGYGTSSSANGGTLANFLGFQVDIVDGVATGTWRAVASDAAAAVLFTSDSGIDTASLHRLEVELNAEKGTVRWFIDNVLVGEWSPGSEQVPADVAGTSKKWMISTQAQGLSAILTAIATFDYGLDGWMAAAASFDSPGF